ncbi:MAG: histidine kinase [Nitriliruptoraceae bacterium]
MDSDATTGRQSRGPISLWLDGLRDELGATRWLVALREGETWDISSDLPSLQDGILAQLLSYEALHSATQARLLEIDELGDIGARLQTVGVERLLLIPGGRDARIILDVPDVEHARRFIAATTGLGTTFDLAAALRAEQRAADLVTLSQWWPEESEPPVTVTLEGTLLAGRLASGAGSDRDSGGDLRRNALLRERARIASVIHEGITQVLTNVSVQLEVLRHVAADPEQIRVMVGSSREAVLQAIESLRSVIFDLTPPNEAWSDLVTGLRSFVADFSSQWGVDTELTVDGEPRDVDAEIVSMAFAFVLEALTNVRRHAKTDAASVTLSFTPDRLILTVADQGKGVSEPDDSDLRPHQGLGIVRSRVRLLNGTFLIESQPDRGTVVQVDVPA